MQELRTLGYAALLILAFVIGLAGTVQLSRILAPAHADEYESLEQPVRAPQDSALHTLPTIEC